MPIFEYVCKECDHTFEELVLPSDEPDLVCPKCQKKNVEKLMSVGSFRAHGIPKGSGGYKLPACGPAASR
jgi:putative FmdB family regulatory protein